jgi:hypothetical protein
MRMVVTVPKATVYGKAMVAGDEFDCPEKEANLWAALARAKAAIGGSVAASEFGLLGESANDGAEASGRRRRGGSYNRRDMRAES